MPPRSTPIAIAIAAAIVAIGPAAGAGCSSTRDAAPATDDASTGDAAFGGCPPGTAGDGAGACVAAGVPADACGAGFVGDGDQGCAPVLPDAPCPVGQVAWLGETACHELVDCGDGPWGDVPTDAATVYVDGASAATAADGTRDRPWRTIASAVTHAARGATVAIAGGTYAERIDLGDKPVRLWGRCPRLVALTEPPAQAIGCDPAIGCPPIVVADGADGAEVHAVTILGRSDVNFGARVRWTSFSDVAFRDVKIDALAGGLLVVQRCAFDGDASRPSGIVATGEAFVDRALFRAGAGPAIQVTSSAVVTRTIVDGTRLGLVNEAPLVVTDTLVRGVLGDAVSVYGEITLTSVTIDGAGGQGIAKNDTSRMDLRATTIRHTGTGPPDDAGAGVTVATGNTAENAAIHVDRVRVADAKSCGLCFSGAVDVHASGLYVSDVRADTFGFGIGVLASGGAVAIDKQTSPTVAIVDSVVAHATGAALFVEDAALTLDHAVLDATRALADGTFGDGAAVVHATVPSSLRVTGSRVARNARAGLAAFGAAVAVDRTDFVDDGIDLDAERYGNSAATFEDGGGNRCIADGVSRTCAAATTGLQPPAPGAP